MTRVPVATCQYPIEPIGSMAAWTAKLERLVAEAAGAGARLLVFPEYAAMELVSTLPRAAQADLGLQLEQLQALVPAYRAVHARLAGQHGVYLLAGSFPERVGLADGDQFRNRARLYAPSGHDGVVEKLQMTRFERERWGISRGDGGVVFDTELGMIGVAICYDSEFPLLVRRLVEQGARIILVPSCTDTMAGYWRVRIACQARALENQCYVVQSPTVGSAPWALAVDDNHGAAAVYAPPDRGFPDSGVVAIGVIDQPGWVHASLDLAAVEAVRVDGQVLGHRDWARSRHLDAPVTRIALR